MVVNIGYLSTLVRDLVTVKSLIVDQLVYFFEDLLDGVESKDDSLIDLDEKDLFSNGVLISNQISDSSYSLELNLYYQSNSKAFQGLFLLYSYSSFGLGAIIHRVNCQL